MSYRMTAANSGIYSILIMKMKKVLILSAGFNIVSDIITCVILIKRLTID